MGTSTLTDTIKDPGGNVVATSPGTQVNFRLMANGSPTPGFRISDGVNVASLIVTSATTTGSISQALENNKNITPAGTYYVSEILCPSSQGGTQEWALLSSSSASPQTFLQAAAAAIPSFTPITTVPPSILGGNNVFTGINQYNGNVYFGSGSPWVDVRAKGATGDGTTDDYAAFLAALNALPATGGIILVPIAPGGSYKLGTQWSIDRPVWIIGEPAGNGTGTMLKFASGISGITFANNVAQFSRMDNLYVLSLDAGVVTGSDDGVWVNSHGLQLHGVICDGWGRHGFNVDSSAGGNANSSAFYNCRAVSNAVNGFFTKGTNSNAMTFVSCDASSNGASGFLENSFLGNHYLGCHTASNVTRGYDMTGVGGVNASSFTGCYSESGQPASVFLGSQVIVLGGTHGAGFDASCTALIMAAPGFISSINLRPFRQGDSALDIQMGSTAAPSNELVIFRSTDATAKQLVSKNGLLKFPGALQYSTANAGGATLPAAPNGFFAIEDSGGTRRLFPFYST